MLRGFFGREFRRYRRHGLRRSLLGLGLAALTLALASTLGCAPVTQLHAATNSATQAAAKKPITVTAELVARRKECPLTGRLSRPWSCPYHFTIRFGSLPAGLALNQKSGVMDGTPTQAGTSEFTFEPQPRLAGPHGFGS